MRYGENADVKFYGMWNEGTTKAECQGDSLHHGVPERMDAHILRDTGRAKSRMRRNFAVA